MQLSMPLSTMLRFTMQLSTTLQYIMLLFIMPLLPTTLFTTLQLCTPQWSTTPLWCTPQPTTHHPNLCTTLPRLSQSTTHLSHTTRSQQSP